MHEIFGFEYGHGHSYSETVIGSKRRTVCAHPVAVDIRFDRVFFEIMHLVGVFLRDHVHVGLQDNALAAFHARSRGLADDYIADFVLDSLKAETFAEIVKEFDRLALFLRGTRYLRQRIKVFPHDLWIEIFDCHDL